MIYKSIYQYFNHQFPSKIIYQQSEFSNKTKAPCGANVICYDLGGLVWGEKANLFSQLSRHKDTSGYKRIFFTYSICGNL